jgi:hypothetical protein
VSDGRSYDFLGARVFQLNLVKIIPNAIFEKRDDLLVDLYRTYDQGLSMTAPQLYGNDDDDDDEPYFGPYIKFDIMKGQYDVLAAAQCMFVSFPSSKHPTGCCSE